jgi:hypothetical protein
MEAPLGRVDVVLGAIRETAWIGVDAETLVEIEC